MEKEKTGSRPASEGELRCAFYTDSVDLATLNDAAAPRLGDLLSHLGSRKVTGSSDRGRASSPWRDSGDLNLAFGGGFVTDHVEGKTWNALQLVAEARNLDLRRKDDLLEAARELSELLGTRLDAPRPHATAPRTAKAPEPTRAALVDAEALWSRLPRDDDQGHEYLSRRHLVPSPDDLLRYSTGSSGNEFLDRLAGIGYRCAFPLRDVTGKVRSIAVRFAGDTPPSGMTRVMNLKDAPIAGLAFTREGISQLASGDPEFRHDEIAVVEGATDTLALTLHFTEEAAERRSAFVWTLGAPGVGQAPAVIRAFAAVIRDRAVHVALDTDPAGEGRVSETARATRQAGALVVRRLKPARGKDAAEAWGAAHE